MTPTRSARFVVRSVPALALVLLGASACAFDAGPDPIAADRFSDPIVDVRDGHLTGRLGLAEFDAPASPLDLVSDEETVTVSAVVQLDVRAVLLLILVDAPGAFFVPGVTAHYTDGAYAQVRILGCVGQQVDVYDELDELAEEVDLVVEGAGDETSADVSVLVTGVWNAADPDRRTEASARFVLER